MVLIFVDDVDLATFAAIRYARGLRPTTMRAVHFVIDSAQAEKLREKWVRFGQDIPLEMIDTPDRRLTRASLELVSREAQPTGTQVTVVLPRRGYAPLIGRLLHDRTADKIASVVSQVPTGRHDHPVRRGEPRPPAARQVHRPGHSARWRRCETRNR